jgi:hypothetical protein
LCGPVARWPTLPDLGKGWAGLVVGMAGVKHIRFTFSVREVSCER